MQPQYNLYGAEVILAVTERESFVFVTQSLISIIFQDFLAFFKTQPILPLAVVSENIHVCTLLTEASFH